MSSRVTPVLQSSMGTLGLRISEAGLPADGHSTMATHTLRRLGASIR